MTLPWALIISTTIASLIWCFVKSAELSSRREMQLPEHKFHLTPDERRQAERELADAGWDAFMKEEG